MSQQGFGSGSGSTGYQTGYTGFGDMSVSGAYNSRYGGTNNMQNTTFNSLNANRGQSSQPQSSGGGGGGGIAGMVIGILQMVSGQAIKIASAANDYKDSLKYAKELAVHGGRLFAEAKRDAQLTREHAQSFSQKQKVDYLSSGVEVGGSASVVIEQTIKKGKAQADYMETQGARIFEQYRDAGDRQVKAAEKNLIKSFF